ncbi:MAG: 4-hydroxybenzoate octaprenyltransferase [Alphaproteobacteria bacterium]|nr:4-hydroxybenzoate octaprenyltransferase [Alphaproteobacteria bacterium]
MKKNEDLRISDAIAENWCDKYAPVRMIPYLHLMRLDRPVGIWLSLWPCLWALSLAAYTQQETNLINLRLATLFILFTLIMRSAGCVYNDIVDHEIDAQVERTRKRPLPSGQLILVQAWFCLIFLLLAGLIILLCFNKLAILLGMVALFPFAIYPFMKKITWWPQIVLGFIFNWGAILGWVGETGQISPGMFMLHAGCIFWTLGYDTIYAHQDKKDDKKIGLKSTALRLGSATKAWLYGFYAIAFIFIAASGLYVNTGKIFLASIILAAIYMATKIYTLDINNVSHCLTVFRSNREIGTIIFLGIMMDASWKLI